MWRDYEDFVQELSGKFPHEAHGIRKFYDECWRVFNSLNSLELKSLEEPRYLLGGRPCGWTYPGNIFAPCMTMTGCYLLWLYIDKQMQY